MKPFSLLSRRDFLKLGLKFGGVSAAGVVAGTGLYADSYRFAVTHHQRALAHLTAPLKVAHLSDLHFGRWVGERTLKQWVDATLAERPDLILLTGDFIDYTTTDVAPLLEQLRRLEAPLGVYGVLGNHDYDLGGAFLEGLKEGLERSGVTLLVNEGISLRDDLFLAGTDDLWGGRPDLAQTLAERPNDQACLLMIHIPDLLPVVPKDVDLTLCGHTHGGQVKLPLYGAVMTASRYGRRFVEGWFQDPVTAFVSRGLGFGIMPVRFLSRAEVAVLELTPLVLPANKS